MKQAKSYLYQADLQHPESSKYTTKSMSISLSCPGTQTVRVYFNNLFIGTIPKYNFGNYTDGEDLIIHCHIFVNELDNPVHVVKKSEVEDNVSPRFDLPKLTEEARHNDCYTDVTLMTEGKHFKAHEVDLATQSSFFATRFEECWVKDGGNEINMLDIPADTMDTILTYMYTQGRWSI